jgi:2-polyprenyl-3-methyl-5-hydroxy-6-metoxy-1,4-benzoquinol methylase
MTAGIHDKRTDLADPSINALIRFEALSQMFDDATKRHLDGCGLHRGWHCLEAGAGGGSIAVWLSKRVGPTGKVIATDIDTRFLQSQAVSNLQVWRHDITCDPLPKDVFDLVHTRMMLIHIPERDEVLKRLAAALKPGGWLVAEEFDGLSLSADPAISPGEVVLKTYQAMQHLNRDRRVDGRYGRLLFGRFRALGLAEVAAEGRIFMIQKGSAAARLLRASFELRRVAMQDAVYLTDGEFDQDMEFMENPQFMMPSPILWTAWGRRGIRK